MNFNQKNGKFLPLHGMTNTPTWKTWRLMKRKCYEKTFAAYPDYGAKGIIVCDRWLESFQNFFDDMGERPTGMTIDRIDSKKGYDVGNCRWATNKTQGENKSSTKWITFNGEKFCISDWASKIGITPQGLWLRIYKYHWTIEEALTLKPDQTQKRHKK